MKDILHAHTARDSYYISVVEDILYYRIHINYLYDHYTLCASSTRSSSAAVYAYNTSIIYSCNNIHT